MTNLKGFRNDGSLIDVISLELWKFTKILLEGPVSLNNNNNCLRDRWDCRLIAASVRILHWTGLLIMTQVSNQIIISYLFEIHPQTFPTFIFQLFLPWRFSN
jgi:hypothetical protein